MDLQWEMWHPSTPPAMTLAQLTSQSNVSLISFDKQSFCQGKDYFVSWKKQVPFTMAIGKGEPTHECLSKHSHM